MIWFAFQKITLVYCQKCIIKGSKCICSQISQKFIRDIQVRDDVILYHAASDGARFQ